MFFLFKNYVKNASLQPKTYTKYFYIFFGYKCFFVVQHYSNNPFGFLASKIMSKMRQLQQNTRQNILHLFWLQVRSYRIKLQQRHICSQKRCKNILFRFSLQLTHFWRNFWKQLWQCYHAFFPKLSKKCLFCSQKRNKIILHLFWLQLNCCCNFLRQDRTCIQKDSKIFCLVLVWNYRICDIIFENNYENVILLFFQN